MKKRAKTFTISAVAEQFELHPQTLRLYEREGLLKPSRSEGNTRLYTDTDLERLEIILSLTRDLGVNLAGVEIILNMREKMDAMQREFERFFDYLQTHAEEFSPLHRTAARSRRPGSHQPHNRRPPQRASIVRTSVRQRASVALLVAKLAKSFPDTSMFGL